MRKLPKGIYRYKKKLDFYHLRTHTAQAFGLLFTLDLGCNDGLVNSPGGTRLKKPGIGTKILRCLNGKNLTQKPGFLRELLRPGLVKNKPVSASRTISLAHPR